MRRLFLAALVPATAMAAPFDLVHQGRLTDADGAPLDGAHDVDITLSSDAAGTVVLGTPHRFTGLDFDGGYYTVRLTGLDSAWFAGDVYVQTTIDSVDVGDPVFRQPNGVAGRHHSLRHAEARRTCRRRNGRRF